MRKHSFFLASCLFLTVALHAQIKQGAIFLGGDIGFSTHKTTSSDNVNNEYQDLVIMPVFGKAVKDNLVVGVDAIIGFSKSDYFADANDLKRKSFGLAVFARKYKLLGNSGFYLFVQGRLAGEYIKTDAAYNTPTPDELKEYWFLVSFYPGVSYDVSKRLQLETGFNNLITVNYIHGKGKTNGNIPVTYKTNSFYLNSSLNNSSYLYVGFRLLINK